MVFITHDLSVLTSCCQRLAIMYAGRVVEEGPSHAVFDQPQHPYTKALAAAFPTIGDLRFRKAPLGLAGDPPDPRELPPGCPFGPRCAEAVEACTAAEPDLRTGGPLRRAACIHVEERA
jgi:oligopeptide/dipeptide ABC transporter ATP-binding protein